MTTTANTESAPEPAPTKETAEKAAAVALAAEMVRREAMRWLTSEHVTVLGQQVAASIDHYQQQHRRSPTWADALAGVDPELLAPIHTIPDGFPLRPALWRLELRQRLMIELRRVRWISYNRNTRSLHPGDHGRGWLTTGKDAHRHAAATPTISAPPVIPPGNRAEDLPTPESRATSSTAKVVQMIDM